MMIMMTNANDVGVSNEEGVCDQDINDNCDQELISKGRITRVRTTRLREQLQMFIHKSKIQVHLKK